MREEEAAGGGGGIVRRGEAEVLLAPVGGHEGGFGPGVGVGADDPVVAVDGDFGVGVEVVREGVAFGEGVVVGGDVDEAEAEALAEFGALLDDDAAFAEAGERGEGFDGAVGGRFEVAEDLVEGAVFLDDDDDVIEVGRERRGGGVARRVEAVVGPDAAGEGGEFIGAGT